MKIIIFILITLIILIGGYFAYQYYFTSEDSELPEPLDQSDLIACTMEAKLCPDGSSIGRSGPDCEFTECPVFITVNNPKPDQEIESPLVVEGEAKGTYFFEGDFPILLTNWDGLIITEGYATVQSDLMTEDFVKFKGEIKFEKPELYNNGTLILQKDNPSGLPMFDYALEIPVVFK